MYEKCPPKLAERLLRVALFDADCDAICGDLAEEYAVRRRNTGPAAAGCWYWWQVVRTVPRALITARQSRAHRRDLFELDPSPVHGDGLMGNLLQDLRYGIRSLAKAPTFTVLTIVTLALAMGVNTAIFSILNIVFVRGLPLEDPERLGFIYSTNPQLNATSAPVPEADFLDYRNEVDAFDSLAAVDRSASFTMTTSEEPIWIEGFRATANLLDVWGQTPLAGRWFTEEEDRVGGAAVAVLAHGSWERRFGFDPEIVGTVLQIDGVPTTIIGIARKEMELGSIAEAEIWVPARLNEATASREARNLWVMGRLAPDATLSQAQQQVEVVRERIVAEDPRLQGPWNAIVYDIDRALAPPNTWTILSMLALTVSFVMLIACSNVATMMLTRAAGRAREIAVRAALGARRRRLLGQLLSESAVLSITAGLLGLLIARLSLVGLIWMAGENSGLDIFQQVELDRYVLGFTLLIVLVSPLLFGFGPALKASRPNLNDTLRDGSRSATGGLGGRRFLVAAQVALAMALVVVAGLLMRGMLANTNYDPGFNASNLMTMRTDVTGDKLSDDPELLQHFESIRAAIGRVPGVSNVALMGWRPAANDDPVSTRDFRIEGLPEPEPSEIPSGFYNPVSPETFAVLALPMHRGRDFTAADNADSEPVAIVTRHLADRFWNGDAVGTRIQLGDGTWRRVVGVTTDIHTGNASSPTFPIIFVPMAQSPSRQVGIAARTSADPLVMTAALRDAVWSIDPTQPVADMRSVDKLIEDSFAAPMTLFSIFVAFAVFAVAMSAAGIYGVISYAVGERTREIGIRIALGAQTGSVLGMITRQALWLVAVGMAAGGVAAFFMGRAIISAIPDVESGRFAVLALVVGVFAATAMIAAMVPAQRAARVDPVTALRAE